MGTDSRRRIERRLHRSPNPCVLHWSRHFSQFPYRKAWCAGPFLYDYIAVQLMNEGEYERYFQFNTEEE